MSAEEAKATLRRIAAMMPALDEPALIEKFLERVSLADEPEMLRAALVESGARTILREAR